MEQCYAEFLCITRRIGLLGFVVRRHIYSKHLDVWLLFGSRAEKTPGHLFVVKFYGRVNTIKVMSNQSINSAAKEYQINASSSPLDFRIEAYIIKIFYNALKFVSYHSIVTTQ